MRIIAISEPKLIALEQVIDRFRILASRRALKAVGGTSLPVDRGLEWWMGNHARSL